MSLADGERRDRPRYGVPLALFVATCLTTTWVGVWHLHPELSPLDLVGMLPFVLDGVPYSAAIMSILVAHEMGHYVVARLHGVRASLPYFLPVPLPQVGTMGAVIVMRDRIPSRNTLVDWAAAGPLAGLVVALPVLAYGLHLSPVGPMLPAGAQGPTLLEGNSVVYLGLKYAVKGAVLPGGGLDVHLHPVAWAGWLGLLITTLNLLPIGQLDGGHVVAALLGERHERVSRWLHRALLVLGLGVSAFVVLDLRRRAVLADALALGWGAGFPWVIWWGLLALMKRFTGGRYHPPVGADELSTRRRRLGLLMLVIFVLIFVPIPLRLVL